MIRDARVLRAGFVPREVEHRDAEVNHLSSVLEPITNEEPADTAIVTGPSGAGKTCISQFVTERLREEVLDVETTYINCWRNCTSSGRSTRSSTTSARSPTSTGSRHHTTNSSTAQRVLSPLGWDRTDIQRELDETQVRGITD